MDPQNSTINTISLTQPTSEHVESNVLSDDSKHMKSEILLTSSKSVVSCGFPVNHHVYKTVAKDFSTRSLKRPAEEFSSSPSISPSPHGWWGMDYPHMKHKQFPFRNLKKSFIDNQFPLRSESYNSFNKELKSSEQENKRTLQMALQFPVRIIACLTIERFPIEIEPRQEPVEYPKCQLATALPTNLITHHVKRSEMPMSDRDTEMPTNSTTSNQYQNKCKASLFPLQFNELECKNHENTLLHFPSISPSSLLFMPVTPVDESTAVVDAHPCSVTHFIVQHRDNNNKNNVKAKYEANSEWMATRCREQIQVQRRTDDDDDNNRYDVDGMQQQQQDDETTRALGKRAQAKNKIKICAHQNDESHNFGHQSFRSDAKVDVVAAPLLSAAIKGNMKIEQYENERNVPATTMLPPPTDGVIDYIDHHNHHDDDPVSGHLSSVHFGAATSRSETFSDVRDPSTEEVATATSSYVAFGTRTSDSNSNSELSVSVSLCSYPKKYQIIQNSPLSLYQLARNQCAKLLWLPTQHDINSENENSIISIANDVLNVSQNTNQLQANNVFEYYPKRDCVVKSGAINAHAMTITQLDHVEVETQVDENKEDCRATIDDSAAAEEDMKYEMQSGRGIRGIGVKSSASPSSVSSSAASTSSSSASSPSSALRFGSESKKASVTLRNNARSNNATERSGTSNRHSADVLSKYSKYEIDRTTGRRSVDRSDVTGSSSSSSSRTNRRSLDVDTRYGSNKYDVDHHEGRGTIRGSSAGSVSSTGSANSNSTSLRGTSSHINEFRRSPSIEHLGISVLPERTMLRRQRRLQEDDHAESTVEKLEKLRARITGALSEVKGVIKQYSADKEGIEEELGAQQQQPPAQEPVKFRFVRKIHRHSTFEEEDEAKSAMNAISEEPSTGGKANEDEVDKATVATPTMSELEGKTSENKIQNEKKSTPSIEPKIINAPTKDTKSDEQNAQKPLKDENSIRNEKSKLAEEENKSVNEPRNAAQKPLTDENSNKTEKPKLAEEENKPVNKSINAEKSKMIIAATKETKSVELPERNTPKPLKDNNSIKNGKSKLSQEENKPVNEPIKGQKSNKIITQTKDTKSDEQNAQKPLTDENSIENQKPKLSQEENKPVNEPINAHKSKKTYAATKNTKSFELLEQNSPNPLKDDNTIKTEKPKLSEENKPVNEQIKAQKSNKIITPPKDLESDEQNAQKPLKDDNSIKTEKPKLSQEENKPVNKPKNAVKEMPEAQQKETDTPSQLQPINVVKNTRKVSNNDQQTIQIPAIEVTEIVNDESQSLTSVSKEIKHPKEDEKLKEIASNGSLKEGKSETKPPRRRLSANKPKDDIRRASIAAVEGSQIEPPVSPTTAAKLKTQRRPSDSEAVIKKRSIGASSTLLEAKLTSPSERTAPSKNNRQSSLKGKLPPTNGGAISSVQNKSPATPSMGGTSNKLATLKMPSQEGDSPSEMVISSLDKSSITVDEANRLKVNNSNKDTAPITPPTPTPTSKVTTTKAMATKSTIAPKQTPINDDVTIEATTMASATSLPATAAEMNVRQQAPQEAPTKASQQTTTTITTAAVSPSASGELIKISQAKASVGEAPQSSTLPKKSVANGESAAAPAPVITTTTTTATSSGVLGKDGKHNATQRQEVTVNDSKELIHQAAVDVLSTHSVAPAKGEIDVKRVPLSMQQVAATTSNSSSNKNIDNINKNITIETAPTTHTVTLAGHEAFFGAVTPPAPTTARTTTITPTTTTEKALVAFRDDQTAAKLKKIDVAANVAPQINVAAVVVVATEKLQSSVVSVAPTGEDYSQHEDTKVSDAPRAASSIEETSASVASPLQIVSSTSSSSENTSKQQPKEQLVLLLSSPPSPPSQEEQNTSIHIVAKESEQIENSQQEMPELKVGTAPVQAVLVENVEPHAGTLKVANNDLPEQPKIGGNAAGKKKLILKKLIRKNSSDKPKTQTNAQQSSTEKNDTAEVLVVADGDLPSPGTDTTVTDDPETPPIDELEAAAALPPPVPKKPRKIKRKVIIKRQQRRLSVTESNSFFTKPDTDVPDEASNNDVETLERAVAYVTDDEAESSSSDEDDSSKQLKTCMKAREYHVGECVLYAERFKKTQVRWKKGHVLEPITSISYKLQIDGKEVPAHIMYIKRYTDRKVHFGSKEYLEINYEQIEQEEQKARSYSIWNMS